MSALATARLLRRPARNDNVGGRRRRAEAKIKMARRAYRRRMVCGWPPNRRPLDRFKAECLYLKLTFQNGPTVARPSRRDSLHGRSLVVGQNRSAAQIIKGQGI